jgi:hypothetical protein
MADIFDAVKLEVVRMPQMRHEIAYWGVLANRSERPRSNKRKICAADEQSGEVEDQSVHTQRSQLSELGGTRALSLDDSSDADSADESARPIRRSPSTSINSESMFSAAPTHAASCDWNRDTCTERIENPFASKSTPAPPSANACGHARAAAAAAPSAQNTYRVSAAKKPKKKSHLRTNWLEEERGETEMAGPIISRPIGNTFA